MAEKPVIILGAGATKACGGPLTEEILPAALNGEMADDNRVTRVEDREELLDLASQFLRDCFNVPVDGRTIKKEYCPSLPMVLSMLHRSATSGLPLGNWEGDRLVKAKRAIEYAMFAVIEAALRRIPSGREYHRKLLQPLYRRGVEPSVVSLNYDVIVDNAMFALADRHQRGHPPDYRVDIRTNVYKQYRRRGVFGKLLKIHGSLNWLYCEKCKRLDLFASQGLKGRSSHSGLRTAKALNELYDSVPFDDAYSCRGTPCRKRGCKGFVTPILITPTYVKHYENPHVDRVWKEAERAMKQADRALIIGYSLPTDDVEVAMLFKRGLDHLPRNRITIVEYVHGDCDKDPGKRAALHKHPTGQRFRSLFGQGLDWHTTGFQGWLEEQRAARRYPFSSS